MTREYDETKGIPAAWYYRADEHVHLNRDRQDGLPEPKCVVCGDPIRWVLDMFSFTSGFEEEPAPFALAHARCVWKDTAFIEQGRLAHKDADEQ